MTLSIGFFYERYRFYAPDEITDLGNNFFMTVPAPFGGVLGDFKRVVHYQIPLQDLVKHS